MSFISSASTLNPSLAWSMGNGGEGRVKLEFPFKMDWYREQVCTKFLTVQHRKEPKGFQHEFLVLQMMDGSICRVERMGDPDARFNALTAQGSLAHDFAQVFTMHANQAKEAGLETSEMIAETTFPSPLDLKDVLNICRAIHEGEKTRSYTLQGYNCYFFALALQCCLVRLLAQWDSSKLFGTWPCQLEETISQLQSPSVLSSALHSRDYRSEFILTRIFSSLTMRSSEDSGLLFGTIAGRVYEQLYHRIDSKLWPQNSSLFHQHLQYTLDCELWHSHLAALPISVVEQEVKQCLLSVLYCEANTRHSEQQVTTEASAQKKWATALIKLVSLADVRPKCPLTAMTIFPISGAHSRMIQRRYNHSYKAATILEMNYRAKRQSELAQNLTCYQWVSICRIHFTYLLQWSFWILVAIANLWGIRLFGSSPIACTIIEAELEVLLGNHTVDFTTLELRTKDILALCESGSAIWINTPWTHLYNILEPLEGDVQPIELQPASLRCSFQKASQQSCSIQEFQTHILDRIDLQAELVERVRLGSAITVKAELKNRLSEIWTLIREEESHVDSELHKQSGVYILNREGIPDHQFNWLEAFETYLMRRHMTVNWVCTQIRANYWEATVHFAGRRFDGKGLSKQRAKGNAIIKLENAAVLL
ncbi:hypothetical protein ACGC1H_000134 [Rhizoctonia solani]